MLVIPTINFQFNFVMFVFKIITIIKEVLSSFETMDLFQVVFVEHLPGIEVDNGMC